jgi:MFS family permease
MAMGLGFSFVPISISALSGVEPAEAGLASGLINTSQQIGGALGIAALSTIAASRTDDALAGGSSPAAALVQGFNGSLYVAVGIAVVGIVAALALIRREPVALASVEQLPVREQPVLDLAA